MGCVWTGFGRGLGLQVGAKLSQVGPKIEILASSGCSWAPFGRILVPKSCQHGPQGIPRRLQEWIFGGFSVVLIQILHIFINKLPGMSVTGPRRKTQYVLQEGHGARHIMSCTRAAASWEGGLANLVVACSRSMGLPFSLPSKPHVQGRPAVCA